METQIFVSSDEEVSASAAPETRSCGKLLLVLILVILGFVGCGVGVYFYYTSTLPAKPSTYIFENILTKSDLATGNFTCSVLNIASEICPKAMQDWSKFLKFKLQSEFLDDSKLVSRFERSYLTLTNDSFVYTMRAKSRVIGTGYDFNSDVAQEVFESNDFDWSRNVSFGVTQVTSTVLDLDPEFKGIEYHCSPGSVSSPELQEQCRKLRGPIKQLTNMIRGMTGMPSLNLTFTKGVTQDFPMITTEMKITGFLPASMDDAFKNIIYFHQQLTSWCYCVKTFQGILIKGVDVNKKCFDNHSIKADLRFFLDFEMCRLDERIQLHGR